MNSLFIVIPVVIKVVLSVVRIGSETAFYVIVIYFLEYHLSKESNSRIN